MTKETIKDQKSGKFQKGDKTKPLQDSPSVKGFFVALPRGSSPPVGRPLSGAGPPGAARSPTGDNVGGESTSTDSAEGGRESFESSQPATPAAGGGDFDAVDETPKGQRGARITGVSAWDGQVHPRDCNDDAYASLMVLKTLIPYPCEQQESYTALSAEAMELGAKKEYESAQEKQDQANALVEPLRLALSAWRAARSVLHAAQRYHDVCNAERNWAECARWDQIAEHLNMRIQDGPPSQSDAKAQAKETAQKEDGARGGAAGTIGKSMSQQGPDKRRGSRPEVVSSPLDGMLHSSERKRVQAISGRRTDARNAARPAHDTEAGGKAPKPKRRPKANWLAEEKTFNQKRLQDILSKGNTIGDKHFKVKEDDRIVIKDGHAWCEVCGQAVRGTGRAIVIHVYGNSDQVTACQKQKPPTEYLTAHTVKKVAQAKRAKDGLREMAQVTIPEWRSAGGFEGLTRKVAEDEFALEAVQMIADSNIPMSAVDVMRPVLEKWRGLKLAPVRVLESFWDPLVTQERDRIILFLKSKCYQQYGSTVDGTPAMCEVEAFDVRVVTLDFRIVQIVVAVRLLKKSPNGEQLRLLMTSTLGDLGLHLGDWRVSMQDRAAVNKKAVNLVVEMVECTALLKGHCNSHTLSTTGGKMDYKALKEVTKRWKKMVSQHGSQARLVFKEEFGATPHLGHGVRWWVWWEQIVQLQSVGLIHLRDQVVQTCVDRQFSKKSADKLIAIMRKPQVLGRAMVECAAVAYAGRGVCCATYHLEGKQPLVFIAHELLEMVAALLAATDVAACPSVETAVQDAARMCLPALAEHVELVEGSLRLARDTAHAHTTAVAKLDLVVRVPHTTAAPLPPAPAPAPAPAAAAPAVVDGEGAPAALDGAEQPSKRQRRECRAPVSREPMRTTDSSASLAAAAARRAVVEGNGGVAAADPGDVAAQHRAAVEAHSALDAAVQRELVAGAKEAVSVALQAAEDAKAAHALAESAHKAWRAKFGPCTVEDFRAHAKETVRPMHKFFHDTYLRPRAVGDRGTEGDLYALRLAFKGIEVFNPMKLKGMDAQTINARVQLLRHLGFPEFNEVFLDACSRELQRVHALAAVPFDWSSVEGAGDYDRKLAAKIAARKDAAAKKLAAQEAAGGSDGVQPGASPPEPSDEVDGGGEAGLGEHDWLGLHCEADGTREPRVRSWRDDPGETSRRIWEWWRDLILSQRTKLPLSHVMDAVRLVVLVQTSSASIERVFSQLKLILESGSENGRAKRDNLEYRIFRRCNKDLDLAAPPMRVVPVVSDGGAVSLQPFDPSVHAVSVHAVHPVRAAAAGAAAAGASGAAAAAAGAAAGAAAAGAIVRAAAAGAAAAGASGGGGAVVAAAPAGAGAAGASAGGGAGV